MRNHTLEQKICGAIARHQIVRLSYKKQRYSRTFEPYVIYRSTKDNILVAGWQTKDDSQPLKKAQWHNFEVKLITALTIPDKIFKFDVGFDSRNDDYRNGIICIIKSLKIE